jgi:hypothetical protein
VAAERLSMRKIREILRQKWALGRTHREVAQSLSSGLGTVSGVERRARAAGLSWIDVEGLADEVIETRLYPPGPTGKGPRPWPDCGYLHAERRKPGVTLELLHLEYLEQHPDGYRSTQFCEIDRRWLKRRRMTMLNTQRRLGSTVLTACLGMTLWAGARRHRSLVFPTSPRRNQR